MADREDTEEEEDTTKADIIKVAIIKAVIIKEDIIREATTKEATTRVDITKEEDTLKIQIIITMVEMIETILMATKIRRKAIAIVVKRYAHVAGVWHAAAAFVTCLHDYR